MSAFKNNFAAMNPARRLARNTDPLSSREAARHVVESGKHGEQMEQVLRLVREHPNHTAFELTDYTSLDRYQIQRRASDLAAMGKIKASAAGRKCRKSGRLACTWGIV